MGVDIPTEKRIEISLQYLYGIGSYRAKQILTETGIKPETRARDLKDDEVARITAFIDKNYNDEVTKDGRSGPVEGALAPQGSAGDSALEEDRLFPRHRATSRACPFAVSARRPMRAPARARRRQWPSSAQSKKCAKRVPRAGSVFCIWNAFPVGRGFVAKSIIERRNL